MLLSLFHSNNPLNMLPLMLVGFPCFLFAISIHESAHAYAAYKLGDPTALSLGRISLDPRKHIDPIGLVLWLIVGFGWARPVPVQSRYFKKPKRDLNIVSFAGPLSNFIIAMVLILLWYIFLLFDIQIFAPISAVTATNFIDIIIQLFKYALWYSMIINITLGVFNLLPIPPLDGSKLLLSVLPNHIAYTVYKYERYIQIILYAVILTGGTRGIVSTLSSWLLEGMVWLIGLFFRPFF